MHGNKPAPVWRARLMVAIGTRLLRLGTVAEVAELDLARNIFQPGDSLRLARYSSWAIRGSPQADQPVGEMGDLVLGEAHALEVCSVGGRHAA